MTGASFMAAILPAIAYGHPVPRVSMVGAARELAARDPALATVIDTVGPPRLRAPRSSHFEALARAIVFQQLSGRAAGTIFGRLEEAVGVLTPERLLALAPEDMRACGLSAAKAAAVTDLAQRVVAGELPLDDVRSLDDDALVDRLTAVRGIGRWTAEMFLLFQLRRMDVWPVDDLAVRKGYARIHRRSPAPSPKELMALGDPYRPYRSIAAWYCWRASELSELPD